MLLPPFAVYWHDARRRRRRCTVYINNTTPHCVAKKGRRRADWFVQNKNPLLKHCIIALLYSWNADFHKKKKKTYKKCEITSSAQCAFSVINHILRQNFFFFAGIIEHCHSFLLAWKDQVCFFENEKSCSIRINWVAIMALFPLFSTTRGRIYCFVFFTCFVYQEIGKEN